MRFIAIFFLLLSTTAWAQRNPNNLPQCPEAKTLVPTDSKSKWYKGEQTASWNECWGLYDREMTRGIVINKEGMSAGTFIEEHEGEWRNGLLDGIGQVRRLADKVDRLKSQSYFYGKFKDGKPNGQARYVQNDSDLKPTYWYDGEFKDGEFEGKGTEYNYLAGELDSTWEGTWKAGKMHGRFIRIERDGRRSFGTYQDGQFMN